MSAFKRSNSHTVTQNPSEVTDILNRFFSSVGQTLADNIPSSNRHLSDYFGDQVYPNSFFFDPVTPSEIESEILLTPLNRTYGLYSGPIRILKGANHVVSATLAEIMNMSVQTGVYPAKLKHAKVIPVCKTGNRTELGNYRPNSLLSVFNRLFERLMHKSLTSFIEKTTFVIMHSVVSEQTVLLNTQFWILSTEYKVIWTPFSTRAAYLLI